jgi:hypothetical protein
MKNGIVRRVLLVLALVGIPAAAYAATDAVSACDCPCCGALAGLF